MENKVYGIKNFAKSRLETVYIEGTKPIKALLSLSNHNETHKHLLLRLGLSEQVFLVEEIKSVEDGYFFLVNNRVRLFVFEI